MLAEIYLDNNATTHPSSAVRDALADALKESYGNASSAHRSGERARKALTRARDAVASLMKVHPDSIVFGSGATELNCWVLSRLLQRDQPTHLITSQVEHSSVLETAAFLESNGVRVTRLPVDNDGRVDAYSVLASIESDTALVSIQWVNNETGVIQPVEEVAEVCARAGVPLHSDAAQALGKLEFDPTCLPVDFLSTSAHKMHGPSGIGALYVRNPSMLQPLLYGGKQEMGRRPGTENILGIIGFGRAAAERAESLTHTLQSVGRLRDRFEERVMSALPDIRINGSRQHRVSNSTNIMFPGIDGAALVALLDCEGVRCSQSSACTSSRPEPSYVLRAMGHCEEEAFSSIRFSFSIQNRMAEIETAASIIIGCVKRLSSFTARTQRAEEPDGAVRHEV